jgi:cell fate regulator YaaT (PSP1 superfamily)
MTEPSTEKAPNKQVRKVAGVHFSKAGKIEYYLAENIVLSAHDLVVIRGDHGNIIGKIIVPSREISAEDVATNIKSILRKATPEDINNHNLDMEHAREGLVLCEQKIKEHGLPMKLVDVSYEDNKAIFFFFAEERIDFRALVKDMASSLHMRIEMRQIGARDEAKALGSLGPCGLVCCCEAFLTEFSSISISMAKNQGLSPNPAKLTGMCGKLKCCLSYENCAYQEERKELPPIGAKVKTNDGNGTVTGLDILKHLCTVRLDDPEDRDGHRYKCSDCHLLSKPKLPEKEEKEDVEYEKLEG